MVGPAGWSNRLHTTMQRGVYSSGNMPWECPDLGRLTLARGSQKSLHHPTASPFLLMNPTAPVFNLSLLTAHLKPAFVRSAHRAVFAAHRAEGAACQQSPQFFFFSLQNIPVSGFRHLSVCYVCWAPFLLCKQREILSLGGWDRHWDGQGVTSALLPSLQRLLHLHP